MLKLWQAWFSTSVTTFEAFWAHPLKDLLAVQEGIYRIFELLVSYICTYIATECRNRSENLINRKFSIFYIKTILQFFFQLRFFFFFFGQQKKIKKSFWPKIKIWRFFENRKFWSIYFFLDQHFRFSENFRRFFFGLFFSIFFLLSDFFNFFFGVGKKIDI